MINFPVERLDEPLGIGAKKNERLPWRRSLRW